MTGVQTCALPIYRVGVSDPDAVDRLEQPEQRRGVGDNGDGGPHRFTIVRGDTVKVFFRKDKLEIGTVVGISHAEQKVRVRFREGTDGQWIAVGQIYPAVEPEADGETVPLSEVIEQSNETPQEKGWTDDDRVTPDNVEIPDPPEIVVQAVDEIDHAFDELNEFVRVYGEDRGPVEWLHAKADKWLDRQLAARSTLLTARRISEKNGWDWQRVLELAHRQEENEHSNGSGSGDSSLRDSPGKGVESLSDNHRPYTFDDFRSFHQRLESGEMTASALHADFERLSAEREAFVTQLISDRNATQLKILAARFGAIDAKRNTKQQNAEYVHRSMLQSFSLRNSITYQPLSGETYEDARSEEHTSELQSH